jgi:hypothetical protein
LRRFASDGAATCNKEDERAGECYRTAVRVGEPVPADLLAAQVQGAAGTRSLGEYLCGPTVVVFLRHFG